MMAEEECSMMAEDDQGNDHPLTEGEHAHNFNCKMDDWEAVESGKCKYERGMVHWGSHELIWTRKEAPSGDDSDEESSGKDEEKDF